MAPRKNGTASLPDRRARRRREPTQLYEERLQELLAAAAETFKELGYQSATLGDVAKRAGVNRASMYYYFPTKEDLFIELMGAPLIENERRLSEIVGSSDPAPVKLERALAALMESYDRRHPVLAIYFEERFDRVLADAASPRRKELFDIEQSYLELWTKLLEDGRAAGELEFEGSARLMSFMIFGVATYTSRWYRLGGSITGEALGAAYARRLLHGLLPEPAATIAS